MIRQFARLAPAALALALAAGPLSAFAADLKFQSAVPSYPLSAVLIYDIASSDLNGDGHPDAILSATANNQIVVLQGNGDGTFRATPTYLPVGPSPRDIAIEDFNGDGFPDIAVTNYAAFTVSILLGNGDGTFQPQTPYAAGNGPTGIAAADVNGDGHIDLAIADNDANTVAILYGNGSGGFAAPTSFAVGLFPRDVVAGDYDRDGHIDLAVANSGSASISMMRNNGDGSFATTAYPAGNDPARLVSGDFNGDGLADLAAASNGGNGASVLLGLGDGTFGAYALYPSGPYPLDLETGDYNGDGILDLALQNQISGNSILFGNGDGTFLPGTILSSVGTLGSGDWNGDGLMDLAYANGSTFYTLNSRAEGALALSAPSFAVSEDAGSAVVTVDRSGSAYGQTAVRIRTTDGTALAGTDYTAVDDTIVFHAGETTHTYAIPIIDNSVYATTYRSFGVTISDPTNEASLGAQTSATVTIQEDDPAPDVMPPAWPAGAELSAAGITADGARLTWPAAADDRGVDHYELTADGAPLADVNAPAASYDATGMTADTAYSFAVTAVDAAGNRSVPLNAAIRTAPVPSAPPSHVPSSENRLKLLTLMAEEQPLSLSPAFDKDIYAYKATTTAANIVLDAEPLSAAAAIQLNGEDAGSRLSSALELQPGENTIRIDVLAENGGTQTYGLTIERQPKTVPASGLADIDGHWAEGEINEAYALGLVKGDPDGSFHPDRAITRAEWAVMAARWLQLGSDGQAAASTAIFADQDQIPAWAIDAVSNVEALGIFQGYSDGTFRPFDAISRAETAAVIARGAKWETDANASASFEDAAAIPAWARPYAAAAAEHGIMTGMNGNRFEPFAPTTRAEAAAMLVRLAKQ